jgi:hypothetical protein
LFRAAFPIFSQIRTGDFLIAEKPHNLIIYNKYQQKLSPPEKKRLVPFLPMLITEMDGRLSDGFTRCMKVVIENELYYLLRDEHGTLRGTAKTSYLQVFKNSKLSSEKIYIIASHTIQLLSPDKTQTTPLKKNISCNTYFENNGFLYVKTSDNRFGWVQLLENENNIYWKYLYSAGIRRTTGITPEISKQLRTKINEANHLLSQLFAFFNNKENRRKPAPYWSMTVTSTTFSCVIKESPFDDAFAESQKFLATDISNIISNTTLRVYSTPGKIEIR